MVELRALGSTNFWVWMKSCGVAVQMKPLSQFLHTVPSKPTPWRVIIIFRGRRVSKGKFLKWGWGYILLEDVECHGGGRRGGRWQVRPIKLLGGGGGNCAWIFSRITHYHKGSLGLSHTGILCFEVAHIMNLNFLLMYFVELYRCMFVWIPSFSGWKLSRSTMKWLRDWKPKNGHCWHS